MFTKSLALLINKISKTARLENGIRTLGNTMEKASRYRLLASLYFQKGKMEKSLSSLSKVLQIFSDDQGVLFDLGAVSLRTKDHSGAMVYFNKLLQQNPLHSRAAYIYYALACYNSGQTTKANILFQIAERFETLQSIDKYPTTQRLLYGKLAHYLGAENNSLTELKDFNIINNTYNSLPLNIPAVIDKLPLPAPSQYSAELENSFLNAVVDQDLTSVKSRYDQIYLNNFYRGNQKYQLCIILNLKMLAQNIVYEERLTEQYWSLADSYQKLGLYPEAIKYTKKILDIDPQNQAQIENLTQLFIISGKVRKGLQTAVKLIERDFRIKILKESAQELVETKRYKEAILVYKQILKLEPGNFYIMADIGESYACLAEALFQSITGQPVRQEDYWQKYLDRKYFFRLIKKARIYFQQALAQNGIEKDPRYGFFKERLSWAKEWLQGKN